MIENRSVPPKTILPHVMYRDLSDAIVWLARALGFREHYRYGEPDGAISGAQVYLGSAWLMLKRVRGKLSPAQLGYGTQSLTVFIEDVEAHFARAESAGAKILEEPHETVYGEFQYAAEDLDGHHWLFSRHAKDLSPADWGAQVAEPVSRLQMLPRPRWCYLEIPAIDVRQSVAFYENVFGWNIRHREAARPSFDDASGDVSGAWVNDRPPAREPGLLPYIWVDGIEAILAKVSTHGGVVVDRPKPDAPGGDCLIATVRDPAGNWIGLYQEGED
jgi:predicted enzyme related to lactoylglutathione lyase